MYYQKESGIYVYYKQDVYYDNYIVNKIITIYYSSLKEYFYRNLEPNEVCYYINDGCVVYDENGKQYVRDVLVGLYRAWIKNWKPSYRNRNGRKKQAHKGFRSIHTFQEHKWAQAWNDEEFTPECRAKRQGHCLPNYQNAEYRNNQKSWKFQSKRKHQWR